MIFRNSKATISAPMISNEPGSSVPTKSEEEGWEVVKPSSTTNPANGRKEKVSTPSKPRTTEEMARKMLPYSSSGVVDDHTKDEDAGNPVLSKPVVAPAPAKVETRRPETAGAVMEQVDIIPVMPLQDLVASIDWSRVVDNGSNSYYLVKRNVKTVALLFLLGVFCAHGISGSERTNGHQTTQGTHHASVATNTSAKMFDDKSWNGYDKLIRSLQAEIQELQTTNRKVSQGVSLSLLERNHWRAMAVSCDHDLRETLASNANLEDEVKQSKWLAPIAFFTSPAPRMNATAVIAPAGGRGPEPSPMDPRPHPPQIPYAALSTPEDAELVYLLPKPVPASASASARASNLGSAYTAIVVAPSVAVTVV